MDHKNLRELAKSVEYQMLYRRVKELNNIKLFENSSDLSEVQQWFLHYLEVYNSLYYDLAMEEKWISQEIIDSPVRTEAYLLYKSKKKKDINAKDTKEGLSDGAIIFKAPNKKE